jgi:phosphinothricin acetyltransferase
MSEANWSAVKAIYEQGIATGNATMETRAPEWGAWDEEHLKQCRLAAMFEGKTIGWAALTPVSGRCVFGGVAELSVYVAEAARGQAIGKLLLMGLIEASEKADLWTLQAQILRENTASIALHKACGFREVGYRERIGQLNGVWRDIVLMERRSGVVGM